jgi:hypothetical protein
MKKFVLIFAAAALMFVGCTQEKPLSVVTENPNSIGFDMSTGKTGTRATTNNLAALKADATGIGIYATNTSSSAEYIANIAYKWDTSGSKWVWNGTEQTWPTTEDGYPLNFYAYFPKSGTSLTTALTQSYTIVTNPANQKDLLAANHTGVITRPSSSNVSLDFKHMLSKVDFKMAVGAGMTAYIQSIAVHSAGSIRTFNYGTLTWNATAPTANANYSYMVAPVSPSNEFIGQSPVTPAAVTGSSGSLMLMPQDFTSRAWDKKEGTIATSSYIEVVYRMIETQTGKDVVGFTDATNYPDYATVGNGVTGSLFVKVGYPLDTNWAMGKAYTYTIYLGTPSASGGNLVNPNFVEDNGSDSGLPVVDPSDDTPIPVPDPIVDVDKPIGFTVSVSDWTDATGVPLQ